LHKNAFGSQALSGPAGGAIALAVIEGRGGRKGEGKDWKQRGQEGEGRERREGLRRDGKWREGSPEFLPTPLSPGPARPCPARPCMLGPGTASTSAPSPLTVGIG